jgi:hypothetical protein
VCNEAFKGIPTYARKQPSHDDLQELLASEVPPEVNPQTCSMQSIRSKKHETFVMLNEREPTDKDDKRYHVPNSYETLPWGHYKIQ